MKYLSVENAKTIKGESLGYLTGILYLAPHTLGDGKTNLCPASTAGCRASCLFSAGRGRFQNVIDARMRKTREYLENPRLFVMNLIQDVKKLQRKAAKLGLKPCVRLNGTSDIDWENIRVDGASIFRLLPNVQFYDYTKRPERAFKSRQAEWPANYHLTFSASEVNAAMANKLWLEGVNTAQVFQALPTNMIDGTAHDLRFLDPPGSAIALVAKGFAKKDLSGFVTNNKGENK